MLPLVFVVSGSRTGLALRKQDVDARATHLARGSLFAFDRSLSRPVYTLAWLALSAGADVILRRKKRYSASVAGVLSTIFTAVFFVSLILGNWRAAECLLSRHSRRCATIPLSAHSCRR